MDLDGADLRALLVSLVGYRFGPEPERRLDEIRAERARYMERFIRLARIGPEDTVLEIGSGCGFGTRALATAAKRVLACDISPAYLAFARRELAEADNVEWHEVPSRDLSSLPGASVDKVVSVSVFIHLNLYDIYLYFIEIRRVIKAKSIIAFDFADAHRLRRGRFSRGMDEQFLEHVQFYGEDPARLAGLVQWNSAQGIDGVAKLAGFRRVARRGQKLAYTPR